MPIIKYVAVHASPIRLIRYITAKGKTENALISEVNCSSDVNAAYEEMKFQFEAFTGERFYKKSLSLKSEIPHKEEIRMHHYIQSFKPGEVSAAEAHRIGLEWAKAVFGNNRSVIVSTHIDRGHIHNHFAVAAFDTDGKRWYGNKTTLRMCRNISDKIALEHGLSVIEKPKYRTNQRYHNHQMLKAGKSWKQKLCDDIDKAIVKDSVHNIDELLDELKAQGYGIRRGKYISIKVKPNRKPIRTYRLGDGYSLEHLEYRILHKDMEMPLSEVFKFEGVQRELALCIRQIQIEIYCKPENDRLHLATYQEVLKSLEVLSFVSEHNIKSADEFERKVAKADEMVKDLLEQKKKILGEISEEERIIEDIPKYVALKDKDLMFARDIDELAKYNYLKYMGIESLDDAEKHKNKITELKEQAEALDGQIAEAKNEKKAVENIYRNFTNNLKSDYEIFLERAKAEIEEMKIAEQREKEKLQKRQSERYSENRNKEER